LSYAITARGLRRTFGSVVAVDGIDLDVPTSQIYGFLGPNGSGKSTTIRMMCGLLKPTAGEITVLGHDALAEAETVRRKLGYMTQRFSLWEDLTGWCCSTRGDRCHGGRASLRQQPDH